MKVNEQRERGKGVKMFADPSSMLAEIAPRTEGDDHELTTTGPRPRQVHRVLAEDHRRQAGAVHLPVRLA